MGIFKKKTDNLIKESVKTVKEEFGRSIEPWAIFAAAIALFAFMSPDGGQQTQQPIVINIFTQEVK